jgi:Ca2+-binding EF-hand superfamily protein
MSPKSPSNRHIPTAYLPLATAFESLSQRRAAGGIDAVTVQRALGLRSLFLADRLLAALGGHDRRFETAEEFVTVAQRLMSGPPGKKLEFLFRLHDIDGDGCITRAELDCLMHIALAENDLKLAPGEADRLVDAVMRAGDLDGDGKITAYEFVTMMAGEPELQRRLTEYGVALLMPGRRARARALPPGSVWGGRVRGAALLAAWVVAWVAVNAAIFAEAFVRYRQAGASAFIQVARGAGACLNFDCAFIVVPMLRHTLTWVRRAPLGRIAPVDDAVVLHRLVGEAVLALSLLHAGAHALNAGAGRLATFAPWAFVTATRANATGTALLALFAILWVFSRRLVRRSGRFELFHVTHLLYFPALPLLFVHAPHFWMWGAVPWLWYLVERGVRARRRRAPSRIVEVTPMASGVTRLVFERPRGWRYAAGDYVFLRIPAVARTEWHRSRSRARPRIPSGSWCTCAPLGTGRPPSASGWPRASGVARTRTSTSTDRTAARRATSSRRRTPSPSRAASASRPSRRSSRAFSSAAARTRLSASFASCGSRATNTRSSGSASCSPSSRSGTTPACSTSTST